MSRRVFDLTKLDAKWTAIWKSQNTFLNPRRKIAPTKGKIYSTSMFPYPSGILHMGHLRVYTIADALARYYRMQGHHVINPMGWDAFGLPAENAAVERNVSPEKWTRLNIAKMKAQMELMFADFDWDREITTCDPDYYKWTQKLFLSMYKHGYAYRKKAEINWDPVDQTVLANEQVDSEGRSWRSGAIVEKKQLEQWFLGITKFANELNQDLEILDQWPDKVKAMQKNWIGQSVGAEIKFKVGDSEVFVYTTRPETLYSVQYLALAADHPFASIIAQADAELAKKYETGTKIPLEAVHPLTQEKIPVFVAPYVISSYGHGAVMGCPAHDQRDFEFWKNMGETEIVATVEPASGAKENEPFFEDGVMNAKSGLLAGLTCQEARAKIIEHLESEQIGKKQINYRLRDWLVSRQRYWGAPIPMVHCDRCGTVPVPDDQLPVLLPAVDKLLGKGGSPLAKIAEFVNVDCPSCGGAAKRDTDTMDTFVDSSWYLFRYLDSQNKQDIIDPKKVSPLMCVDQYLGGVEHAILHLLYVRFVSKFLSKIGYWDGSQTRGEPIKKLVSQGMVHGKTFSDPQTGKFLKPDEYEVGPENNVLVKETGEKALVSFEKMSKSKYNGADPGECIERHGADATRAHILFQAPIEDVLNWEESKIVGVERWLNKVLSVADVLNGRIGSEIKTKPTEEYSDAEISIHNETQQLLASITDSFARSLSMNTVISDYMKYTNKLYGELNNPDVSTEVLYLYYLDLLKAMSPVAPGVCEEANEVLHPWKAESVLAADWPQPQPLIAATIPYTVMVNGKMRFIYPGPEGLTNNKEECIAKVIATPDGQKWIGDRKIKKVILKPSTIVFIVEG
ncbi:hypothetical protein OGAPHI_006192 [Ogataea philodendri]|uniref:leucine--tRNA ligase n=1 Tax=Ogataea philodendri TaxID=1378263 RepID=A0A9P8T0Z8_9ASCO|nr:uncharacterized protein OGAPHI_006192 [Ogataea philodendri]KAH3662011.1 hypothetical protein OGAPHI_006192 [Ogataea philodendri]